MIITMDGPATPSQDDNIPRVAGNGACGQPGSQMFSDFRRLSGPFKVRVQSAMAELRRGEPEIEVRRRHGRIVVEQAKALI